MSAIPFVTDKKVHALTEDDIGQTGYVVDTLYAALYSLLHGDSYESTIRLCVCLGYDTDTACAVAGSAAGVLYGADAIPARWLQSLRRTDYLEKMAREFAACMD